jgi:RNA polymerase sigma-70 factor (ECF subfamily)
MLSSSACFPGDDTHPIESAAKPCRSQAISTQITTFTELIRPFERAIYLAALAFVYDPDEALELAQESVFQAFKSLPDVATAGKLKSWLIEIVIDKANAFLRERNQVGCEENAADDELNILDFMPGTLEERGPIPGSAVCLQQTRDNLSAALGRLSLKFRVVLFLRDVLGFTTTETAQRLGVSEETVRKRLACARFGVCAALDSSNGARL